MSSSYTDDTIAERRGQTAPPARDAAGLIRRMAVRLTSGALWRAVGHLLLDNTQETKDAEVFGSLGFYSRPATGANAEVIVVHPGGAANAVIVATRDEALRKLIDSQLPADAAAMCNRATIILCKPDGTVEIRAIGGSAQSTILGQTYRSAEDTMLTAVSAAIALISNIPGLTAPQLAIVTAATAAITTFKTAAATYLTTVLRAQ